MRRSIPEEAKAQILLFGFVRSGDLMLAVAKFVERSGGPGITATPILFQPNLRIFIRT
jgi:hypothetical protein